VHDLSEGMVDVVRSWCLGNFRPPCLGSDRRPLFGGSPGRTRRGHLAALAAPYGLQPSHS